MSIKLIEFPNYDINPEGELFNRQDFRVKGSLNHGHLRVKIKNKYGVNKSVYIHQLVAMTFLDNIHNYKEIDHIDGNKINNNVSNLRYCSSSQNNCNKKKIHTKKNIPHSKFKFITWNKQVGKWQGEITIASYKKKYVGVDYDDEKLYYKCLTELCNNLTCEELQFYNREVINDIEKYEIAIFIN